MNVLFAGITSYFATDIGEHSHNIWEILYYINGTGTLKIGEEELRFEEGDIICQPPFIPHSEHSEKGFRNIFITVSGYKSPGGGIVRFKDNSAGDFRSIIMQLYKEYHIKQKNWERIVDSLFQVLHQYMAAWSSAPEKSPLVEEFEGILVANIANPGFRINKYLEGIPMSPDHFRKVFKRETGKTPLEYLVEKRIENARQLLASEHHSAVKVKEAAILSGFDDPYYFSRAFKRLTGKSPSSWRKNDGGKTDGQNKDGRAEL